MVDQVKACLQDFEELPKDFTTLFDTNVFGFDLSLVPEAISAYAELGLKKEPLSLIQPQVMSFDISLNMI